MAAPHFHIVYWGYLHTLICPPLSVPMSWVSNNLRSRTEIYFFTFCFVVMRENRVAASQPASHEQRKQNIFKIVIQSFYFIEIQAKADSVMKTTVSIYF